MTASTDSGHLDRRPPRGSAGAPARPVAIVALLSLVALLVGSVGTGLPAVADDPRFEDVPDDHRFAEAIAWLVEQGITTGRTETRFDPDGEVTRGQMAVFLWRFEDSPAPEDPPAFDDVPADAWNAEAVAWLTEAGITRGVTATSFGGAQPISRAQMATFLWRLNDTPPVDGPPPFDDVAPDSTHANAIRWLTDQGITQGVSAERFAPAAPVTRSQMAAFLFRMVQEPPADEPDPTPDPSLAVTLTEAAVLNAPIAGAVGPDGTLYLAERSGRVLPLTADGIGEAVLDLSDETTVDGERGLLGLAFSADGSELYTSSTDLDGATTLQAFAIVDGEVQADDRRLVYFLEQPFNNHNGGDVHIGPDGLLYLGLGDGGGGGDPLQAGQDLTTPLGALLRIDPQGADPYAVPDDNPFVDVADAAPEIFAYGLRNPWRFSFDEPTSTLWIADVGQQDREEINRVRIDEAAGANFGWNLMEGTRPYAPGALEPDDHVPPIYEYHTRGEEGCAITGGVVYRGQAIPELDGVYLYADFCNGSVRGLQVDDDGEVLEQFDLGIDGGQVVSFATDADGEVYVLSLDGRVQRIDRG